MTPFDEYKTKAKSAVAILAGIMYEAQEKLSILDAEILQNEVDEMVNDLGQFYEEEE